MRHRSMTALLTASLVYLSGCGSDGGGGSRQTGLNPAGSAEPFSSTVYLEPDLLTTASPSTFTTLGEARRAQREMLDLRTNTLVTIDAYVFDVQFDDGAMLAVSVNPDFADTSDPRRYAERFATDVGRLPAVLRTRVTDLWIHPGDALWGSLADRGALIVHTGSLADYVSAGIVEETLLHESVHVAIDPLYQDDPGWQAARVLDDGFVSTYARENPDREDFADSFPMWLVARQLDDVGDPETIRRTEEAIPARLDWFDQQGFDLAPLNR